MLQGQQPTPHPQSLSPPTGQGQGAGSSTLSLQPLTFGGVARIARGTTFRLLLIQSIFAVLVALSVVWLAWTGLTPCIREAIGQLPDRGRIQNGQLEWPGHTPVRLAGGAFVSVVVDLNSNGELGQVGDFQFEFHRDDLWIRSLLGFVKLSYPTGWTLAFNRTELDPWWGAWQLFLLIALGAAVCAILLLIWALEAILYMVPARTIAFYFDRELSWLGAWRLCGAAMMPGALLLASAICAYSVQRLNLIQLLFAGLLHLIVGWVFVLISPLRLPSRSQATRSLTRNPFAEASAPREKQ